MFSGKAQSWTLALLYVVLIYLTLEIVRVPLSFLRTHGILRITLYSLYGIITAGLFWALIKNKFFSPQKLIGFFIAIGLYFYLGRLTTSPEEQVHFLEYGLAGVLFLRAFRNHFKNDWVVTFGALFLASLAGWLDEVLQGLSATRHYDIRDVYLNFLSATLGLFVYRLVTPPPHDSN